jgi:hypothetical protein
MAIGNWMGPLNAGFCAPHYAPPLAQTNGDQAANGHDKDGQLFITSQTTPLVVDGQMYITTASIM